VHRQYYVANQSAYRVDEGNAPAAIKNVEAIAEEGCQCVPREGTEEDEGDDGVGEVVIFFDLRD